MVKYNVLKHKRIIARNVNFSDAVRIGTMEFQKVLKKGKGTNSAGIKFKIVKRK